MELVLDLDPSTAVLREECDRVRAELVDARLAQRRKDTLAAQARVAECMARMDALLDLWNEAAPAVK